MTNCKQIISSFVERYGFNVVYSDSQVFMNLPQSVTLPSSQSAMDYLQGAALAGKKVIAFYEEAPIINVTNILRGECIIVANKIPKTITVPTIFCKKPDDLQGKLITATKVSMAISMPIMIVVSDNVVYNISSLENEISETGRSNPYIASSIFEAIFDNDTYMKSINTAHEILSVDYPKAKFETNNISFYDIDGEFFDYLLPRVATSLIASLNNKTIHTTKAEKDNILNYLALYNLSAEFENKEIEELAVIKDFLCAGCPFVLLYSKLADTNTLVFSNTACQGVKQAFGVNEMSLEAYAGLVSSKLNVPTIFVAKASSYNQSLESFKDNTVIILNDCNINGIDGYPTIKHPKKFNPNKKMFFVYSCNNIKKYGTLKVKDKQFKSLADSGIYEAIEFTKCPAIVAMDDKAFIDTAYCTGCGACKSYCKNNAIV